MTRKGVVRDRCPRCGNEKPAVEMLSRRTAICDHCDGGSNTLRAVILFCIIGIVATIHFMP